LLLVIVARLFFRVNVDFARRVVVLRMDFEGEEEKEVLVLVVAYEDVDPCRDLLKISDVGVHTDALEEDDNEADLVNLGGANVVGRRFPRVEVEAMCI
jgi:hypothetical protein